MKTRKFDIYRLNEELPPRVKSVIEEMRKKAAEVMGVTVSGNRLTLRFINKDGYLSDVHMVMLEVSMTGKDVPYLDPEEGRLDRELRCPK